MGKENEHPPHPPRLNAESVASEPSGPLGLGVGPQQLTGRPAIGRALFCCDSDCSFFERLLKRILRCRQKRSMDGCGGRYCDPRCKPYLLAAINTITATMIVPQMAALAAIVILSMLDAGEATVRTSRHWV
uniref:Uncharacterized protein n=1 Tax=Anopheles farauti TaxID=69004 RepID=A0A182Q3W2_9DIPT